ncbi:MAG: DUF4013 domain-containing protein [Methanomicrobiales archaeon]|nr:DUF4013 domain-containing protein [Methanomicrobiales archaeon]
MEIGTMLEDSLSYAKDAVWEKWVRWILLIICSIIFPLIIGYSMEIYRGKKPAPELENWGKLFIDGLKLFVAAIIYMLPVIIVVLVFGGFALISALATAPSPNYIVMHPEQFIPQFGIFLAGLFVALILAIIIGLIATIGFVRMARTESFMEAFNFSAILAQIGKIGWVNYIIALIVVGVVSFIFIAIINIIPIIGWLLSLILQAPLTVFNARYVTLIYDSAG